jgi:hypothetical protein
MMLNGSKICKFEELNPEQRAVAISSYIDYIIYMGLYNADVNFKETIEKCEKNPYTFGLNKNQRIYEACKDRIDKELNSNLYYQALGIPYKHGVVYNNEILNLESGGDIMEQNDYLNLTLLNELEESETQNNDEREYFTLIYNGKPCKAWLFAKELVADIDGRLFAQGWLFDGVEHHTIKIYMSI